MKIKNKNQKSIKIISELMSFCYKYNAQSINIDIENIDDKVKIVLIAKIELISDETLIKLKNLLSAPRLREVEEYYWNLSGTDNRNSEISLVGMMIDEAYVNYDKKDHVLKFTLIREG